MEGRCVSHLNENTYMSSRPAVHLAYIANRGWLDDAGASLSFTLHSALVDKVGQLATHHQPLVVFTAKLSSSSAPVVDCHLCVPVFMCQAPSMKPCIRSSVY
jgi:hypothetical protein